ncbi:AAA family ATPase [uncultured Varibaculum sp.]|uniref:AAA family ATPase n=1 Tax=uncultured Varibaculum sp. TaxID=413896 RepID=UPI002594D18B|nr:AAA family ATPase [uncultured Varibaculum sp.]
MKFFEITCSGCKHLDYQKMCEGLVVEDVYIDYLSEDFKSGATLGAVTRNNSLEISTLDFLLNNHVFAKTHKYEPDAEFEIFDCNLKIKIEEVTYQRLATIYRRGTERLLRRANLQELWELHYLGNFVSNPLTSRLISADTDLTSLEHQAASSSYDRSLGAELERIRQAPPNQSVVVNYVIDVAHAADAHEAGDILLQALASAGRTASRYVYNFDFFQLEVADRTGSQKESVNENLANAFCDSTLVIDYSRLEYGSRQESRAYEVLSQLLNHIAAHAREIQIVFLVSKPSANLIENFSKHTPLPVVLLEPDPTPKASQLTVKEARRLLVQRLHAAGYSPEGDLLEDLLETAFSDASFNGTIEDLANQWINDYSLATNYSCYADAALLPKDPFKREPAGLERLHELIGLEEVKKEIMRIVRSYRSEVRARRLGMAPADTSLHCVFQGPPGTGKTEVARVYGEILRDLGVLSEGRILEVSGPRLGEPAYGVTDVFRRAKGSVIFIDEAYAILPAFIPELIACMENNRSDTVVILAGYRGAMEKLLSQNEGFRSRIGSIIDFPNYTTDELLEIFDFMAAQQSLKLTEEARHLVHNRLAGAGRRIDQGNARFARNLLADIRKRQQERLDLWVTGNTSDESGEGAAKEPELTLEQVQTIAAEDVPMPDKELIPATEQLDRLIGLQSVKTEIKRQLDFVEIQKLRRKEKLSTRFNPMHMVFTGNPGTGKTEVARLVGKIAHERGILSVGDFFEVSKAQLISPIPGTTAQLVSQVFEQARGSVLFIDEAYSLGDGAAGKDAVDAMVKLMEDMREEIIVIMAGYTDEMREFLAANTGFRSRVRTTIEFPDYSPEELTSIFTFLSEEDGYTLDPATPDKAAEIFRDMGSRISSGNGRFARQLLEEAKLYQAERLKKISDQGQSLNTDELEMLLPEDLVMKTDQLASKQRIGFTAA